MPGQPAAATDDPKRTAANRVRDNQRRARERHKAYFQDLQRKVSEYEKQGVQATLEMQQAARYVAVENEQLKVLLRRKGVGDAEIVEFLRGSDGIVGGSDKERGNYGENGRDDELRSGLSVKSAGAVHPLPVDFTNFQPDGLAILADVSAQQKCCNGQTACTDSNSQQDTPKYSPRQRPTAAPSGPEYLSHTTTADDLTSSTTMSCLAAAKIVADLHGHGDSERARASLGCCDEGECTIKNTAVFQVMDSG